MPYNNYRQYVAVSILEIDLHVQVHGPCSQNLVDLIKADNLHKLRI